MQVTIAGYGTWGDVLPSLALGLGLKRAGHRVRLLLPQDFAAWTNGRGLEVEPLPVDVHALMAHVSFRTHPLGVLDGMRRSIRPALVRSGLALADSAGGSDVILANEWLLAAADAIAQANRAKLIHFALQPTIRTRQFPIATLPPAPAWLPSAGAYNLASYRWAHAVRWLVYARAQNDVRAKLGAANLGWLGFERLFQATPSITLVNTHLIERPADWDRRHRLPGSVSYQDRAWRPSAELVEFVEAGPPPVYIGFGSMHDRRRTRTARIVLTALARSRRPAIVHRGWADLRPTGSSSRVLLVDYVPHGWLFSRMAAIVHHAGAGTSTAALMAGVPSVPVPHSGDQGFWARRLFELGVATEPLPRAGLNAADLAERMDQACRDPGLRARAAALGTAARAEDGLKRAVAAIEQIAADLQAHP